MAKYVFILTSLLSRSLSSITIFIVPMIISQEEEIILFYQKFSMMILASNIGLTGHFELSASEAHSVRQRVSNINWTYFVLTATALVLCVFDLMLMLAMISGLMIAYNANRVKLLLLWRLKSKAVKRQLGFPLTVYISGILTLFFTRSLFLYFCIILIASIILNIGALKIYTLNYLRFRQYLLNLFPFIVIAILNWSTGYGLNFILPVFLAPQIVVDYTLALTIGNIILVVLNAINTYESANLFRMAQIRGVMSDFFIKKNRLVWRQMRLLILFSFVALYALDFFQLDLIDGFVNVDTKSIVLSLVLSFIGLTYVWDSKNILYINSQYKVLLRGSALSAILGLLIFSVLLMAFSFNGLIMAICLANVAQAIIFTQLKMRQLSPKS